jgi:hypothetical protein
MNAAVRAVTRYALDSGRVATVHPHINTPHLSCEIGSIDRGTVCTCRCLLFGTATRAWSREAMRSDRFDGLMLVASCKRYSDCTPWCCHKCAMLLKSWLVLFAAAGRNIPWHCTFANVSNSCWSSAGCQVCYNTRNATRVALCCTSH